jgi:hypothetical protein
MADDMLEIADDSTKDYVERENKDGGTYKAVDQDHIARARLRVDALDARPRDNSALQEQ